MRSCREKGEEAAIGSESGEKLDSKIPGKCEDKRDKTKRSHHLVYSIGRQGKSGKTGKNYKQMQNYAKGMTRAKDKGKTVIAGPKKG